MKNVAMTFTARGFERILRDGGSGDWTASPERVSKEVEFVVCCQNTAPQMKGKDWGKISHKHGEGFIVGKLSEVVLMTQDPTQKKRCRFMFSEYAEISVDGLWQGDRFPVRYLSDEELPFDVHGLEYKPIPTFEPIERTFSLIEAKVALAKLNEMSHENVRILL